MVVDQPVEWIQLGPSWQAPNRAAPPNCPQTNVYRIHVLEVLIVMEYSNIPLTLKLSAT